MFEARCFACRMTAETEGRGRPMLRGHGSDFNLPDQSLRKTMPLSLHRLTVGAGGTRRRALKKSFLMIIMAAVFVAAGCSVRAQTDQVLDQRFEPWEPPLHPLVDQLKLRRLDTDGIKLALSGKTISSMSYPSGVRGSPLDEEIFASDGGYARRSSRLVSPGIYTVDRGILCVFLDQPSKPRCSRLYQNSAESLFSERLDIPSNEIYAIKFEDTGE
jgi:hypothetical protein